MSKINTHLDALKKQAEAARRAMKTDEALWSESQYDAWCEVRDRLEELVNRLEALETPKPVLMSIEPEGDTQIASTDVKS